MLALYRESRPAEILAISDALGGLSDSERAAQDEFMRDLLQGRNSTMAERAAPLLASGGAFIAVGALHLVGKTGLIERFRAGGYTVTKNAAFGCSQGPGSAVVSLETEVLAADRSARGRGVATMGSGRKQVPARLLAYA
jgi:hypothetical protein